MDQLHSRAICDEIGERLRQILPPEAGPLPSRLQYLLDRLFDCEAELSPSIAPSLEDTFVGNELPGSLDLEFEAPLISVSKARSTRFSNL
jgi:hypothetical protein